ncbi:hypothetical protein KA005_30845 [bacterium]|nr:hypothetical protein [bacterium]
MRIIIEYDSCWQNSVLDGSNNQPLPKRGRNFIATSESLNIEHRPVTKDTVMGVLCRLIGDQKKLYQSRSDHRYFFKELEDKVDFNHLKEKVSNEIVYVRNTKTNTNPQHCISGVIQNDTSLFYSPNASQLWSILYLDLNDLIDFVSRRGKLEPILEKVSPSRLVDRVKEIQALNGYSFLRDELSKISNNISKIEKEILELESELKDYDEKEGKKIKKKIQSKTKNRDEHKETKKKLECDQDKLKLDEKHDALIKYLNKEFPNQSYIENNGTVKPIRIYSAGLYLQLERMERDGIDIGELKNANGKIQGFSVRGFNGIRDFLSPFTTGGKAKNQGNPFKDRNGQALTKASGQIEITIDVDKEKGQKIAQLIENAGVSSFYLGKKGLAYVSKIRP